jgi:catechol 2,3-dioxygenase-like lactoylglutathione lyase family enzyme
MTRDAIARGPAVSRTMVRRVDIDRIDHLVLTVDDVERTIAFYVGVLGMREATFGSGRKALTFGSSKIILHQRGREFEPKAAKPTPGSADLCLIADDPLDVVVSDLAASGIVVEEGPVPRTGARAPSQASTSVTRTGT